jgi:Xaa-Pro aminopeptidase
LPMNHKRRIIELRQKLEKFRLRGLLITHMPNVRYLCGFTGSSGTLLVSEQGATLFTDGRYTLQARQESKHARVRIARGNAATAALQTLKGRRTHVVGVEGDHLSLSSATALRKSAPHLRLKPIAGVVERMRMVKDSDEIVQLQAAVMLASGLFEVVLNGIKPGTSESHVAAELEYVARRSGAQGMSFETIVAAGERSAMPHGVASENPIPTSGFVVLDYGVILAGYCSDMTRTVHVGAPGQKQKALYQAVLDAQLAAISAVRPGQEAGKVDQAARKVLNKAGFSSYFTHSTGHGVGLEIHEPPRLGKGQKELLKPGMVITIEPGAYVPGLGGVRIEDMVLVTESGCQVLTPTPKELLTL